jgi:hypothetical protein
MNNHHFVYNKVLRFYPVSGTCSIKPLYVVKLWHVLGFLNDYPLRMFYEIVKFDLSTTEKGPTVFKS